MKTGKNIKLKKYINKLLTPKIFKGKKRLDERGDGGGEKKPLPPLKRKLEVHKYFLTPKKVLVFKKDTSPGILFFNHLPKENLTGGWREAFTGGAILFFTHLPKKFFGGGIQLERGIQKERGINLEGRHILLEILNVIYLAKGFKIKKRGFGLWGRKLVVEEGDGMRKAGRSRRIFNHPPSSTTTSSPPSPPQNHQAGR